MDDLIYELLYTLVRLRLISLPTSQIILFEGLHAAAKSVRDQEDSLREQVIAAEVTLGWRDEAINMVIGSISTALLHIVHNNRKDPRYLRYFGDEAPSDMTRPVLGRKLVTVRGWIDSLQASSHPELRELGALLEQQVAAADEAVQALEQARQTLEDFRLVGARRSLFDRVNTERKAAFGDLAKTVADNDELRLRSESGDLFFRQLRRREPDDSVEAARKVVDKARKALAEAEAELKAAEERAQAAAQAEAQRAADKAALEAIERNVAQANRTAAELRNRIARSKRA
jgi:hypothetical protein